MVNNSVPYMWELKVNKKHEQQVPSTQHQTSASYKKFVEENISCDISAQRRIMENTSGRPDETFL